MSNSHHLAHAGQGARADRERRRSPRSALEIAVEVFGYDAELCLIHALGGTRNVSARGMFAELDARLPIGSRTVIVFRDRSERVQPRIVRGTVVRCSKRSDQFGVAVYFDRQLGLRVPAGNVPGPVSPEAHRRRLPVGGGRDLEQVQGPEAEGPRRQVGGEAV